MPLSHDAGAPQRKKQQLQMVTNADYNPRRFYHGAEFNAYPKNGPY